MSGRGYFPEFWRVSGDRVQSLHWMWQMCEEMPYESNETSRREQTIKRFESETSAWLIMPKISDRFGQWLWRLPFRIRYISWQLSVQLAIKFYLPKCHFYIGNCERCIMDGVYWRQEQYFMILLLHMHEMSVFYYWYTVDYKIS